MFFKQAYTLIVALVSCLLRLLFTHLCKVQCVAVIITMSLLKWIVWGWLRWNGVFFFSSMQWLSTCKVQCAYGCAAGVTRYTQAHAYMLWHECSFSVRDSEWDSAPFQGFFSPCCFPCACFSIIFGHIYKVCCGLCQLITHAGCYNICLDSLPGRRPCRSCMLMSQRKEAPRSWSLIKRRL